MDATIYSDQYKEKLPTSLLPYCSLHGEGGEEEVELCVRPTAPQRPAFQTVRDIILWCGIRAPWRVQAHGRMIRLHSPYMTILCSTDWGPQKHAGWLAGLLVGCLQFHSPPRPSDQLTNSTEVSPALTNHVKAISRLHQLRKSNHEQLPEPLYCVSSVPVCVCMCV